MGKVETDYQLDIKKSVNRAGGYCFKLSNRFTIGVPDLGIWLPPFAPLLAEVKMLRDCKPGFKRQLAVTEKQDSVMRLSSQGYEQTGRGATALVLVVVVWENKDIDVVALPRHADALADGYQAGAAWSRKTMVTVGDNRLAHYDMMAVLQNTPNLARVEQHGE